MLTKIALCLIALLVSSIALAQDRGGGHDGGGGNGLVCYAPNGEIQSVDLLDFFEGRILEGLSIPDYAGKYKEIYHEVIKKSASQNILKLMKQADRLDAGFKFLPEGIRLNPINDSSEIFIPLNCKVEQLANFQGTSRIFIVKDFWDKLSETDKAGLLMHELLWYVERQAGAKTSARARRTVARFFADNYEFAKIDTRPKPEYVHCMTFNPHHRAGGFNFGNSFLVSKIEGTNNCLLSFEILNSVISFTKQTATLEDCDQWFTGNNLPTNGDITTFMMNQHIDVYSYPENLITHEIITGQEENINNGTVERKFTFQVINHEFPGYDEKHHDLFCHTVISSKSGFPPLKFNDL